MQQDRYSRAIAHAVEALRDAYGADARLAISIHAAPGVAAIAHPEQYEERTATTAGRPWTYGIARLRPYAAVEVDVYGLRDEGDQ